MWAVGGDLSHADAVAAQCHQARDDGSFAKSHVAGDNDTLIGDGFAAAKTRLHFLEEPISADEDRLGREAGHLEEKRL